MSDADYWRRAWNKEQQQFGDFVKTGDSVAGRMDEGGKTYVVVHHTLVFSKSSRIQRTLLDLDGLVAGLFIIPGEVILDYGSGQDKSDAKDANQDMPLPEGVTETQVTIESQPSFPLKGLLTRPTEEPVKAVLLLIPGSGPVDRDETVGANKPFRDLAHGLAQKGLASLRYDKITKAYPMQLKNHPQADRFTVDEEMIVDAVNAVKLLRGQADLKDKDLFILGHSQGGSLLAYINSKGVDAAGYIALGATRRQMWESAYEQYGLDFAELEAAGMAKEAEEGRKWAEAEMDKARRLENMSEDELIKETIFGYSAWYFKHINSIKPVELRLANRKPILILHGAKDRQVFMKDYQAWLDDFKTHPDATFRLYDKLNHLFGEYQGEPQPRIKLGEVEYAQRTPVPQYVIGDISEWIESHTSPSD